MRDPIQNPVLDVPSALNDWDDIERARYRSAANQLHETVGTALHFACATDVGTDIITGVWRAGGTCVLRHSHLGRAVSGG